MKLSRYSCVVGWFVFWLAFVLLATAPLHAQTKPTRIVSLSPAITEILFAIGASEQVAGVTRFCDVPAAARKKPDIGGMVHKTVNIEKVLSLQPDLLLGLASSQQETLAEFQKFGIHAHPVLLMSIDDTLRVILEIGDMTGNKKQAVEVVRNIQETFARLDAVLVKHAANAPKVFYQVWDDPLMSASEKSFLGQLLSRAGALNIFAELEAEYPLVNREQILAANPDVIMAPDHHNKPIDLQHFVANPLMRNIAAVRSKRVYVMDGTLISRPGPRIAEALGSIIKVLYGSDGSASTASPIPAKNE